MAEHQMMIVDGEIEVCDTCVNAIGYPVGWSLTDHFIPEGLNLALNVIDATNRVDAFEMLTVKMVNDRIVTTLDVDDDLSIPIRDQDLPVLVATIEELADIEARAKATDDKDLQLAAALAWDGLFTARIGHTYEHQEYHAGAPEIKRLFEEAREWKI